MASDFIWQRRCPRADFRRPLVAATAVQKRADGTWVEHTKFCFADPFVPSYCNVDTTDRKSFPRHEPPQNPSHLGMYQSDLILSPLWSLPTWPGSSYVFGQQSTSQGLRPRSMVSRVVSNGTKDVQQFQTRLSRASLKESLRARAVVKIER